MAELDGVKSLAALHNAGELTAEISRLQTENQRLTATNTQIRDHAVLLQSQLLEIRSQAVEMIAEVEELYADRDEARAVIERVRALHREDEGRCAVCIEYCDCDDINECTHANVPWPCRTAALLIEAEEDAEDIRDVKQARAQGGPSVSLDQVIAQYAHEMEDPK